MRNGRMWTKSHARHAKCNAKCRLWKWDEMLQLTKSHACHAKCNFRVFVVGVVWSDFGRSATPATQISATTLGQVPRVYLKRTCCGSRSPTPATQLVNRMKNILMCKSRTPTPAHQRRRRRNPRKKHVSKRCGSGDDFK